MKTDKLIELVENSDLIKIQKLSTKGFILRSAEKEKLREEVTDNPIKL